MLQEITMDRKTLRKLIFQLSVPVIVEQILVMTLGIVNTILVGRLGKEAISAVSIVELLSQFIIPFFSALAMGATVLVARFVGQGDNEKVNSAAKQAFVVGMALALFVTAFIAVFYKSILLMLYSKADPVVLENAVTYFRITLLTYPFVFISLLIFGILRGAGDTKTPMKVTFFMNILNVVFSYTLIYGLNINLGGLSIALPSLGVKGAAIGVAIARLMGAAVALYIVFKGSKWVRIPLNLKFKFDKEMVYRMFSVGIPASFEQMFFTGGKLVLVTFIVGMGTVSIAADAIGMNILSLFYLPLFGFGLAATSLVGQRIGAGDGAGAERTVIEILKIAMVLLMIAVVLVAIFSGFIYRLYTTDQEIISVGSGLLLIFVFAMPGNVITMVIAGALRGAGDTKYCAITTFIGIWAFRLAFGYLLGVWLHLGIYGIWIGMTLDLTIRAILYLVRFKKGLWKNIQI